MNDNAPAWVEAVTPAEIVRQRSLGWPDFHPEDFCHCCGRRNPVWTAEAETWFEAFPEVRGSDGGGIWCPSCFAVKHAEMTGQDRTIWSLTVWTDPNLPSTSDKEAPSGKPLQAWPHTVHHPGCACLPDVVQPPAAAVPVVPEEPATAVPCEGCGNLIQWVGNYGWTDTVIGAQHCAGGGSHYPPLGTWAFDFTAPPAPVADVEPQPDAPTARAVSEALHNAGVNTTVSASDNGLLIRVSNRYTPRLLDVLDPASAPDVLRMPADVAAAFDALAAAIDSDDKISTIDYLAGRFASKAVRVAGAAVDFMDAARSASGSTKA